MTGCSHNRQSFEAAPLDFISAFPAVVSRLPFTVNTRTHGNGLCRIRGLEVEMA